MDWFRLDATGAIGIARSFTFGGRFERVLYDPEVPPRQALSKEQYMSEGHKATTINHFHEKLLKLKVSTCCMQSALPRHGHGCTEAAAPVVLFVGACSPTVGMLNSHNPAVAQQNCCCLPVLINCHCDSSTWKRMLQA